MSAGSRFQPKRPAWHFTAKIRDAASLMRAIGTPAAIVAIEPCQSVDCINMSTPAFTELTMPPPLSMAAFQSVAMKPLNPSSPLRMSVITRLLDVRLAPFQRASLTMIEPRPPWIAGRYGAMPNFRNAVSSIRMSPRSTMPPLLDVPAVACPSAAKCLAHATMPGCPVPRPMPPCRPSVAAAPN